jgi:hypothetical protein
MNKTKIGCLEYVEIGDNFWSAKDPLHKNKRWIIRKDRFGKLEALDVQRGIERFILKQGMVDYKDHFQYLAWLSLSSFITYLAAYKFRLSMISSLEELHTVDKIFEDLCSGGRVGSEAGSSVDSPA